VRSALGRADADPIERAGGANRAFALAGQIAAKTSARLIAQFPNAHTQRGRGRVSVERIPYSSIRRCAS
jgi:hypothetical protein